MTDQTPDAAREANGFGGYSRADVEDACRAADLVLAHPLTRNVGGPYIVLSTKDAATLVSAARAAVSRARDAAWRSAVEGMTRGCVNCGGEGYTLAEVTVPECCQQATATGECCGNPVPGVEQVQEPCQVCGEGLSASAALESLLARMDTARAGGAS